MVLAFAFNYVSHNGVLENLLKRICEDFDISFSVIKQESIVTLYVEDEAQQLESFADFLSKRLPLSIFFKSSNVEVVENKEEGMEVCPTTLVLPFTPKTLDSVKDAKSESFKNPFVKNEIGLSVFDASSLSFELKDQKLTAAQSDEFEALFKSVANAIEDGKSIRLNSASGDILISKVTQKSQDEWHEGITVMPTDLSMTGKMVVAKENEIKALASLEKPAIQMRLNSIYREKEILPYSRVRLQLANDLLLYLLCEELFALGVEFVFKEYAPKKKEDGFVKVEGNVHCLNEIEVAVLENGEILITKGDGYSASILKENLKKFDSPAHAQFSSIVQEHKLFENICTCFYFSRTHDDMIMHLSKQTGLIELVKFPLKKSITDVFDEIKDSTTGEKLLQNYKEKFPDIFAHAKETKIDANLPKSIFTIWGIAAVVLGISKDIESGSCKIIELAEDFGGNKGPRIDYFKLDEKSLHTEFNLAKMIRSVMSFKLAGTDDVILSYGLFESLAYFVSDSGDFYAKTLSSTHMLMAGSLFASKRLAEIASRNVQPNHVVCFNRELPIDN